ncbi:hypothetical protein BJV77DRAFT_1063835 [Russula vinacea]|nr:hypothetical protein BJV77DRAFT_1063835 [Russula vinacea]
MIDKSQGFTDAPPPYQHALRSASDSKVNLCPTPDPSTTFRPTLSKRHPKARTSAASRWFPTAIFGLSKTAKQVRTATQDFLRDLLSQARPSEHEWLSLLGNCAENCTAHGLSFSSILQEPFVEGHLPIYWAILKRSASTSASAFAASAVAATPVKADHHRVASRDPDALVLAILDASLPLNALSVADARLACVTVSDNALFVRLGQRYEAFSPRLGTDKVLLGGNDLVDTISVVETRGAGSGSPAAAGFSVHFSLTQFQLRMRVSKQARIEFIARGRLWYLAFSVAGANTGPPLGTSRAGEWLVSLGLGENSSPTWVDGRLSIVDRSPPPPSTLDPPSVAQRVTHLGLPLPPKHPHSGKQRNAASLPIKTTNYQISPGAPTREIVVSLDKFLFGATLRNDATSFVDADGTLNAELEVKLQKTQEMDSSCVIC